MKKLKFRIWDPKENKMYDDDYDAHDWTSVNSWEDYFLFIDFKGRVFEQDPEEHENSIYLMPWVVMQYTGFSDKNGQKIYEGDILEVAGGSRIIVNDLAEFLIYCGKYEEKHGVELFPSVSVVGNVYENPSN